MERSSISRAVGGSTSRTIRTSLRQPEDISERLKTLIEGRDNNEIISFLEESGQSPYSHEHFKVYIEFKGEQWWSLIFQDILGNR